MNKKRVRYRRKQIKPEFVRQFWFSETAYLSSEGKRSDLNKQIAKDIENHTLVPKNLIMEGLKKEIADLKIENDELKKRNKKYKALLNDPDKLYRYIRRKVKQELRTLKQEQKEAQQLKNNGQT